jgi:spore coat-associated protein N
MGISMKTTSGKLLASAALVATAAGVAGLGTYGAFTSSTAAEQQVTAGKVEVNLTEGAPGGLVVPASDILPGDTIERVVTLKNTGSSQLGGVMLTTSTSTPTDLTSNAATGLQLKIERCPAGWAGAPGTYTCSGTAEPVLASTSVIGIDRQLAQLTSLTAGQADSLKIQLILPAAANNDFQGDQSTVAFSFNATGRNAQTK